MVAIIIFALVSLAIFIFTLFKIYKEKNLYILIEIGLELIGITSNTIYMFAGRNVPEILYAFNVLFSIIIPVAIFVLEKKGIKLGELFYLFKANLNKEDFPNVLIDGLDKYPNSVLIHKAFAKYYEEKDARGNAIDEYLTLISLEPNNLDNYMKVAKLYKEERKFEDAIFILKDINQKNPENLECSLLLGDMYYENEQFQEALGVYNRALEYHPGEFDIYYAIGMTYTRLNDFESAKEYYQKAAKLNSYRDVANLNLGQIEMILGEYDKAEQFFNEAIKSDDDKIAANGYFNLAKIKVIEKHYDLAVKYSNLAIELDPKIKSKIEKDERFEPIFVRLKIEAPKIIKTKTNEKEEEIIKYLDNDSKIMKEIKKQISDDEIHKE